jgi:hypothetical protein
MEKEEEMQKWEYMNLEMRFPNILITQTNGEQEEISVKGDKASDFQKFVITKLNEFGSKGWELVSHGDALDGTSYYSNWTLKRSVKGK